jgi:hypothetical protein
MSTKFEVITFTASQECYAEALLKIIDPEKKFIKHRYYRDSCVPVFGNYVKVRMPHSLSYPIEFLIYTCAGSAAGDIHMPFAFFFLYCFRICGF